MDVDQDHDFSQTPSYQMELDELNHACEDPGPVTTNPFTLMHVAAAKKASSRKGQKMEPHMSEAQVTIVLMHMATLPIKNCIAATAKYFQQEKGRNLKTTTISTWYKKLLKDSAKDWQYFRQNPQDIVYKRRPQGRPYKTPASFRASIEQDIPKMRRSPAHITMATLGYVRHAYRYRFPEESNLTSPVDGRNSGLTVAHWKKSMPNSSLPNKEEILRITRRIKREHGLVKRKITNTAAALPENHAQLMSLFKRNTDATVQVRFFHSGHNMRHRVTNIDTQRQQYEISHSMIYNIDEAGIRVIPTSSCTLDKKGTRDAIGTGKRSYAQVSKTTVCSADGYLGPYQVIFQGKTAQCVPQDVEPAHLCSYTQTASHFANEDTVLKYCSESFIPWVEERRKSLVEAGTWTAEEAKSQKALLIWDNFKPHLAQSVVDKLAEHNIISVTLPPRCTSKYQPLDVNFNGHEKATLSRNFNEWLWQETTRRMDRGEEYFDVLPNTAAKRRSFIATLIKGTHLEMQNRRLMLLKAWRMAGLAFVPVDGAVGLDSGFDTVNEELVNDLLAITETRRKAGDLQQADDAVDDESDMFDEPPPAPLGYDDDHDVFDLDFNLDDVHLELEDGGTELNAAHPIPHLSRNSSATSTFTGISDEEIDSIIDETLTEEVLFERGEEPGLVRVTYCSTAKPTAVELLDIMKSKRSGLKKAKVQEEISYNENGFTFKLGGIDRALLFDGAIKFAWIPQ